ncbi:MAG: hypothetical protein Q9165_003763, partial [Trypethelium subeluteriae]
GTTGLPKAAIVPVQRIWALGNQKKPSFGQIPGPGGDRWYSCMPMFHGTGGLTMVGNLMGGLSLAIGKRFSVSTFWDDIHDSQCTIFVYVGEAARYLLNAPHHPRERDHPRLRIMYGNGLRPDVWERFRNRFDVPEIAEFFNSTEGLFQLLNHNRGDFTAGAVGHQGALMRRMVQDVFIPVQVDAETGDIHRDSETGFAKRMSYEDGGEILVAISSERAFGGYFNDEKATSKKILHDVFRKGDIFYRTGDALRRDEDGRWYFIDRLGDTFRWKSENVSTAEVAETLGRYPGVAEANVYGVTVPKHDGRAGCVALSLSVRREDFDFDGFFGHARANLPKYAVPVFLRLVAKESSTDNNKQNKVPLREEGIDLDILGSKVTGGEHDVLLWYPGGHSYVKFQKPDLEKLRSGSQEMEKGLDLGAVNKLTKSPEAGVMKISSVLTSPSTDRKRRHVQASESSDIPHEVDTQSSARVDRGQASKRRRSGETPANSITEDTQAMMHEAEPLGDSGHATRTGESDQQPKHIADLNGQDKLHPSVGSSDDTILGKTGNGSDRAGPSHWPPTTRYHNDAEGSSQTSRKGKTISRYDQDLYTPVAGATRGLTHGDPRLLREIDIEIARDLTPDDSSSDEGQPTMFGYYL